MRFQEETPEFIEGKTDYTDRQLELMADAFLRDDARREMCRECGESGQENGSIVVGVLDDEGRPLTDDEGKKLAVAYTMYKCPGDHEWGQGEGAVRGIGGDSPILFEEHIASRKRREIYTTVGTPDPEIVSGIYNRAHPDGRKINTPEQRKRNGASYFRG